MAIAMRFDAEGFAVPQIDERRCTRCQRCIAVCPGNSTSVDGGSEPLALRCWARDDSDRMKGSSGGMFPVLAKHIIERGGSVIGAGFDSNMVLKHLKAETDDELAPLFGSKYIGSDASGIYRQTKELLDNQQLVLFAGTPCQNKGLREYLKCDYKNLFTCDFICYGIGSTAVFNDYIGYLATVYNSKPKKVSFRGKTFDYIRTTFEVEFVSGAKYREFYLASFFGFYFGGCTCNRVACSDCRFAVYQRATDFTLADYGCKDKYRLPQKEIRKGVSQLLLNSEKAIQFFETLADRVTYTITSTEDLMSASNSKRIRGVCYSSPQREEFFRDYQTMDFNAFYGKWVKRIPASYSKQIRYSGKLTGNPIQLAHRIRNRLLRWKRLTSKNQSDQT